MQLRNDAWPTMRLLVPVELCIILAMHFHKKNHACHDTTQERPSDGGGTLPGAQSMFDLHDRCEE